jgi:hypothetical protein
MPNGSMCETLEASEQRWFTVRLNDSDIGGVRSISAVQHHRYTEDLQPQGRSKELVGRK